MHVGSSSATSTPPRLEISILSGTVSGAGKPVLLTNRELELLFAIARRPQFFGTEELICEIWPERDGDAGTNLLKTHLHQLRKRLGDRRMIVRTAEGLRLCDGAIVDLWEIGRLVSAIRGRRICDDSERATIRSLYERLSAQPPLCVWTWSWFRPTAGKIANMRRTVAQALAAYGMRCGRGGDVLDLADEMIEHDPYDEEARELAITAYLAMGNRAAALRQYREYHEMLRQEFQCEPSPALLSLLNTPESRGRLSGKAAVLSSSFS